MVLGGEMKKEQWKEKIELACKDAGSYQQYFDSVIDTLAQILETRDIVHEQFIEDGARATVIKHTDRSNKKNITKNPMIQTENELNSQALSYWNALGLTPSGLKKLKADVIENNESSFEDLLNSLENG